MKTGLKYSYSYLKKSSEEPGSALNRAFERKMESAFDACDRAGISFIPMAVEVLGGWHPSAVLQLDRIANRVAKKTLADYATTKRHLYQRLSICLQRINASLLLARQTSFAPTYVDGD